MLLNHAYPDIFSEPEAQLLASLLGPPITARSRSRVIRANVVLNQSLYLTRGMLGRYSLDRQGRRQFVGIQIVGDYFDIAAEIPGSRHRRAVPVRDAADQPWTA